MEGRRWRLPCANELLQLGTQVVLGVNIHDTQALALADTQPLLHVLHPGTMDGREGPHNAGMLGSPRPHCFTMLRTDVIAHQMNRVDVRVTLRLPRVQAGEKRSRTLPFMTVARDLASPGQTPRRDAGPPPVYPHARGGWAPSAAGRAGWECDAGVAGARSSRPRRVPAPLDVAVGRAARIRSPRRRHPAAAWERARHAGARVSGEARPTSGGRWRRRCPPRC